MVFIPIYDDNSDRRIVPWVTYTLIAINLFVFFVLQQAGANERFDLTYAMVPQEIITGKDVVTPSKTSHFPTEPSVDHTTIGLQPTPISPYITLLTSMFMHGSLMHLLGNMLFLFVFGDNVEDHLGHLRYVLFYILAGVIGSFVHVGLASLLGRDLLIPCLGASGAISGVMAGYVLLYPHRQVTVLILRVLTEMPAYAVIGIWFAFQIISTIVMMQSNESGGVAYGAHVGGFAAGAVLVYVLSRRW